jgi:hypothetical protein
VVIGYLGSDKMPAYLGLLVRRVRSLIPGNPIVLGLWSLSGNLAEEWREMTGAEHVAARVCAELQSGAPAQESGSHPAARRLHRSY